MVRFILFFISSMIVIRLLDRFSPDWSDVWTLVQESFRGTMEAVSPLTGYWIKPYGFYIPAFPGYEFVRWTEVFFFAAMGILLVILFRLERENRELRNDARAGPEPAVRLDRLNARAFQYAAPLYSSVERVRPVNPPETGFPPAYKIISDAINEEREISFDYQDRDGACTHRAVLPGRIYSKGGYYYVEGMCELRQDMRTFRLSRMRNVEEACPQGTVSHGCDFP